MIRKCKYCSLRIKDDELCIIIGNFNKENNIEYSVLVCKKCSYSFQKEPKNDRIETDKIGVKK